jgi:hypothetical protein
MRSLRVGEFSAKRMFLPGSLLFGLCLLSFAAISYAQAEASIQGTVSDASGGAVPGATVKVKSVETAAERTLFT